MESTVLLEPAVGSCLCDLLSGLVRKCQGTETKVSGPDHACVIWYLALWESSKKLDVQKNNSAQGSPDGFLSFRYK
jgi:hypothetical protein